MLSNVNISYSYNRTNILAKIVILVPSSVFSIKVRLRYLNVDITSALKVETD